MAGRMIRFSLLMMIINGIIAITIGKSLQPNDDHNRTDTGLRMKSRIKREAYNGVTLTGDRDSCYAGIESNALLFLATFTASDVTFCYNKFKVTQDLGITSWDIFLSNYRFAEFNDDIHIKFFRRDGKGRTIDAHVRPSRIYLNKILTANRDSGRDYDRTSYFTVGAGPDQSVGSSRNSRHYPFDHYKETILDETIWVGLANHNVQIRITMDGYIRDNQLILEVIYKSKISPVLTTVGVTLQMDIPKQIVLK